MCRFEIWPHGDEGLKKDIGMLHISNEGGPQESTVYSATYYDEDGQKTFCSVRHNRNHRAGSLVCRALTRLGFFHEESPPPRVSAAVRARQVELFQKGMSDAKK